MTKYRAHWIRFVDHQPSGISYLAVEDVSDNPRLAVVREDATIELWNADHRTLVLSTVVPRFKDKYLEKVVWCNGRLISFGVSGEIIEWNVRTLSPTVITESQGGSVWSALPNHSKDILALGCEDGVLRLFDVKHGLLDFLKSLTKHDSRIMAVAWSPEDMVIAAGGDNGVICLYNPESGRITTRMTCENKRRQSVIIWALTITQDMMLISTNSIGQTQFWDINTGTLYQSFNSHEADVLTLCLTQKEDVLFTSGVDSKVVQFSRIENAEGYIEWKQMKKVRSTKHDIRSLVMTGGTQPFLISGGVEPRLVRYSYNEQLLRTSRRLPLTPFRTPFSVARNAHLLLYQEDTRLNLWQLPKDNVDGNTGMSPIKLLEMTSSRALQITSSDISDDGQFIAFGNCEQLKCCYMQLTDDKGKSIQMRKLKCNHTLRVIHCLAFGKKQLAVFHIDGFTVLNCNESALEIELSISYSNMPDFEPPCGMMTCSQDGKYCAAVDNKSTIYVISMLGKFSPLRLPSLPCLVTGMAFKPKSEYLFWTCSLKHIHVYNVIKQKFLKWSTRACELRILDNILAPKPYFTHISFSPTRENEVYLLCDAGLVKIDLRKDLPEGDPPEGIERIYRKKRTSMLRAYITERGQKVVTVPLCNFKVSLLHTDFCSDGSIVIVEKATRNFFDPLPPPLRIKKFGF